MQTMTSFHIAPLCNKEAMVKMGKGRKAPSMLLFKRYQLVETSVRMNEELCLSIEAMVLLVGVDSLLKDSICAGRYPFIIINSLNIFYTK
jgi:hypothetical protein